MSVVIALTCVVATILAYRLITKGKEDAKPKEMQFYMLWGEKLLLISLPVSKAQLALLERKEKSVVCTHLLPLGDAEYWVYAQLDGLYVIRPAGVRYLPGIEVLAKAAAIKVREGVANV